MKRLKCILLIGILSCAIGCQNQNITAVSEEEFFTLRDEIFNASSNR